MEYIETPSSVVSVCVVHHVKKMFFFCVFAHWWLAILMFCCPAETVVRWCSYTALPEERNSRNVADTRYTYEKRHLISFFFYTRVTYPKHIIFVVFLSAITFLVYLFFVCVVVLMLVPQLLAILQRTMLGRNSFFRIPWWLRSKNFRFNINLLPLGIRILNNKKKHNPINLRTISRRSHKLSRLKKQCRQLHFRLANTCSLFE